MDMFKTHARLLLVERTDSTTVQFIRYGLVAAIAFVFDFGTYALLVRGFDMHSVLAATLGFSFGLIVNYLLSILWVFKERARSKQVEMIAFFVIGIIGLILTDIIIWILAIEMHQDELLAKLIATAIVFFWNFGARKFLLFKAGDAKIQDIQQ